ncbi:4-(cytidine 5'-diphospho)-2-C-methyl-D-erythritol kinase [soil metagenome]
MTTIRRAAHAKINLGLHVLHRRADAFHEIETVMLPIGWADILEATAAEAPTLTLSCSDPSLPTGHDNLVLQAAVALQRHAATTAGAVLHLQKNVPYGAGLGSGSSDAANTLLALRDLWQLDLSDDTLESLAAMIGSDAPFFIRSAPAVAQGRGERLRPLIDHTGVHYRCPFHLVVAMPPVHVNTAEAYRLISPCASGRATIADVVLSNDLSVWRSDLVNDFEEPIMERYPQIARTRDVLLQRGAGYAAMSGSGAAVFGVFTDESAARRAADSLTDDGCAVWVDSPA